MRKGSEGLFGNLRGVRRAPQKSGMGREGPRKSRKFWEGTPEVREM